MTPRNLLSKLAAFSLIELVIFIVILGIVGTGLMVSFSTANRHAPKSEFNTVAIELAKTRLEIIAGQRSVVGFNPLSDPCATASPPAPCTPPSGYTVTATITNNWSGNTMLKLITVTTTGKGNATLSTLVGDY